MKISAAGAALALVIVFVVIMLSAGVSKTQKHGAKCEARGGVEVRTYHGFVCIKAEKIAIP